MFITSSPSRITIVSVRKKAIRTEEVTTHWLYVRP